VTTRPCDSLDRTATLIIVGVFVALVDRRHGPANSSPWRCRLCRGKLQLSNVSAGALATYTLLGMGIGGILAGWLADRIGRVRVVWWAVLIFSTLTSRDRLVPHLLADRRDAVRFGNWHRRALQCRHAVGRGVRPDACANDRARDVASRWSVGYVAAALLAGAVSAAVRLAAAVCLAIVPGIAALALLWNAPDPPSWTETRRDSTRTQAGGTFGMLWADRPVRRTFLLWTVTAIAPAVRLLRREFVAAELSGQRPERQRAEHGLVRRRHLHDDGHRQNRHRLPRGHRRAARDVDRVGSPGPPPICPF
jgi:AAHS family cis,cis-muconate transporter-like MFS transporter